MSEERGDAVAAETIGEIFERVESAAVVDRAILEDIMAAILARGHVLLEDVPGTGKTVTARVLAEALGLSFTRIQFTPDLLPSDVTGSNIYNEHEGTFEFSEGPVFTNVLLADEINRAPPKTQAALLEAMEERQVSVDGTTHPLPEPFVVIATQNPVEQEGTFRLPEAQRDRFAVKTSFGYPNVDGEMELLDRRANRRSLSPSVDPVVDEETVTDLQEAAEDVTVEERVRRYIIDLARATRMDERTDVGVSPRGVQRVFEAARSRAVVHGRDFVTPEDVKRLAPATMAHRLVLSTEATVEGVDPERVVDSALSRVDVPAVSPNAGDGEVDAQGVPAENGDARQGPATRQSNADGRSAPQGQSNDVGPQSTEGRQAGNAPQGGRAEDRPQSNYDSRQGHSRDADRRQNQPANRGGRRSDQQGQQPNSNRQGQQPNSNRQGQQPNSNRQGQQPNSNQQGQQPPGTGGRSQGHAGGSRQGGGNQPPRQPRDDRGQGPNDGGSAGGNRRQGSGGNQPPRDEPADSQSEPAWPPGQEDSDTEEAAPDPGWPPGDDEDESAADDEN